MAEASAAKQKKWYDPTYSHGMTPEERDAFLGSPDSAWLLKLGVLRGSGKPIVQVAHDLAEAGQKAIGHASDLVRRNM